MINDKLLGGKTMEGVQIGGKVYLAEPDVRRTVQAALATNEKRNARIAELERDIAALREALAALATAMETPFPPEDRGHHAQVAWSLRRSEALERARVLTEPCRAQGNG